jgi:phospholipid/cholesterol/gamma-HCH transport system substrate-binding protein
MSNSSNQNLRVGLFIFGLVLLGATMLFFVGGASKLLEERYMLNAYFKDVGGLKPGAIVRLSGLDVGEILSVQFSDRDDQKIHVRVSLERKYQDKIRLCDAYLASNPQTIDLRPSVARIETVGVLGDKFISISIGDDRCSTLESGSEIPTQEALDILEYTKKATEILGQLNSISRKVDNILGTEEETAQVSLAQSFQNLQEITKTIKDGDGLISTLLYDEKLPKKLNRTLTKAEQTTNNLKDASRGISKAMDNVETGSGLAHELIYGENGESLAKELEILVKSLEELTDDVKNEDSLVNALIYDPSKKQILDDLLLTTEQLKETIGNIEHGDGTIALMMRDPTLYEDIRSLVGGAQRNKLLRTYIRRTIEEAEKRDAEGFDANSVPTDSLPKDQQEPTPQEDTTE